MRRMVQFVRLVSVEYCKRSMLKVEVAVLMVFVVSTGWGMVVFGLCGYPAFRSKSKTAGAAGMRYRRSLSTGTVLGGAVDSISGAVTML
jgi:hypothetical protein